MYSKSLLLVCIYYVLCINSHSVRRRSADWSIDMEAETWNTRARDDIDKRLKQKHNHNIAKNVILYLGDGMGIATVTAGRILKGQLKKKNGEEEVTVMESLDNLALSKV
jgi:alkaline phosphatase